jgi:hypothetical protein
MVNSGTGGPQGSASILVEMQRTNVSGGGCEQRSNIKKTTGKINMNK